MTPDHKSWLVILSFAAAFLFFILAALTVDLGSVLLVPAGLTALAAGFLIGALP